MQNAVVPRMRVSFVLVALALGACTNMREAPPTVAMAPVTTPPVAPPPISHAQVGEASVYARSLSGKTMASGKPFDPNAKVVASKTLPIGSTAKVTNLKTGKSTIVKVEDRGPLPKHRLVDLSPATAKEIGVTKKEGIAPVSIKPISSATTTEASE